MTALLTHLRRHVVAYIALFVALGGTGYAATSIPKGSVGTAQLRNGAVTPAKLNPRTLTGVRAWAVIAAGTLRVEASSTRVQVMRDPNSGQLDGIRFRSVKLPRRALGCAVIAQPVDAAVYNGSGLVSVQPSSSFVGADFMSVALVC